MDIANPIKRISEYKKTFMVSRRLLSVTWNTSKSLFIGNLIAISIPAIIPFVNAYIYKLIIDLVVSSLTNPIFDYNRLYLLIGLRMVTLFVQDAAFSAQGYFDLAIWTKIPAKIYELVLSRISNLDLQYFEDSSFKDKLEKVRDTYAFKPVNMLSHIFYTFQSMLQLLIALFAIATLNWVLIFVALLAAIPTFISETKYAKITWGVWHENSPYRKKFWYISELMQDAKSIKELKIFQAATKFLHELKSINNKFIRENTGVAKKQFTVNIFSNIFGVVIYIIIEIFIILSAIARNISIGDISYYTAVINNFQNSVNGLFRNTSNVFKESLYVQEMFDVLDTKPKIIISDNAIKIDNKRAPRIEFKNVGFTYPGSDKKILNNFSLIIESGQKIALVGENGAGKTTLVKLVARFYDVDEGEILIDGISIKSLDLVTWYQALGILFQDFIRYEYTIKENIGFGKIFEEENIEKIKKAAKLSGADKIALEFAKGYDQMLGKTFEGGVDLSAGQWQKIALARAFLRNAPILILDEPTASIDAKAEAEIFEHVEKLTKDKTVIIISHRFSTVRNADKIYIIDKGKIKEEGSHKELIDKNGVYATLFNLQASGYK